MNRSGHRNDQRVLVTGSRGKSSIVRLLHAAFQQAGLQSYARITGVVPRELSPEGIRTISRSAGAHVGEMRWWLRRLPASAQCITMENSAISPDFQALAGSWLRPDITILSSIVPDHQEVWGPGRASAAEVLASGIPTAGQVLVPTDLEQEAHLRRLLNRRRCEVEFVEPVSGPAQRFQAGNIALALAAAVRLGLDKDQSLNAMRQVEGDRYDFRVLEQGGASIAMAFSANDIETTRSLFDSLSWSEEETRLIYNHRSDRPGRFRSFLGWLNRSRWREVMIIGDRPYTRRCSARYLRVRNIEGLLRLFQPEDRVFGCGNIAGLPLELADVLH